jgi:hypothetical protein
LPRLSYSTERLRLHGYFGLEKVLLHFVFAKPCFDFVLPAAFVGGFKFWADLSRHACQLKNTEITQTGSLTRWSLKRTFRVDSNLATKPSTCLGNAMPQIGKFDGVALIVKTVQYQRRPRLNGCKPRSSNNCNSRLHRREHHDEAVITPVL